MGRPSIRDADLSFPCGNLPLRLSRFGEATIAAAAPPAPASSRSRGPPKGSACAAGERDCAASCGCAPSYSLSLLYAITIRLYSKTRTCGSNLVAISRTSCAAISSASDGGADGCPPRFHLRVVMRVGCAIELGDCDTGGGCVQYRGGKVSLCPPSFLLRDESVEGRDRIWEGRDWSAWAAGWGATRVGVGMQVGGVQCDTWGVLSQCRRETRVHVADRRGEARARGRGFRRRGQEEGRAACALQPLVDGPPEHLRCVVAWLWGVVAGCGVLLIGEAWLWMRGCFGWWGW